MEMIIKKGLDVPLRGKPEGKISELAKPSRLSLNLDAFSGIRFKVYVKPGDRVKIGQPLVENKGTPGQMFVSVASGQVKEVRRGLKRRLLNIVIETEEKENFEEHGSLNESASKDEILQFFMKSGIFPHIRMRPFDLVANPKFVPRDIFVKAIETLPFAPSYEMQVENHEEYFQQGLKVLAKLTTGKVHLVYKANSSQKIFSNAENMEKHTITGPHPAGNSSLHIHKIAPIQSANDIVWTLNALDVVVIGKMAKEGRYFVERILAVGGSGIIEGRTGYFKGRAGFAISDLISNRIKNQLLQFISGDPLTGTAVEAQDFLGFYHNVFTCLPKNTKRQLFHFLRLGISKYSATKTYLSGHVKPPVDGYPFTTNQHGEARAFIDGAVYNKVMPMKIPTMALVKAILVEDFEQAERLGIFEVAAEDFALPTFICPSKIEMMEIVKEGLHQYSKEMGF